MHITTVTFHFLGDVVYADKIVDEIAFASSAMIAFAMIAVIALFWANSSRWPVAYFNQKYLPQHYQLDAHKYTHFTIFQIIRIVNWCPPGQVFE